MDIFNHKSDIQCTEETIYSHIFTWLEPSLDPLISEVPIQALLARPKNAGGKVALPPGRYGSIRKILGYSLLKTSLKNSSGQLKICHHSDSIIIT